MLTVLRKLAVQSISDPDDVVILTNISEGVEGATVFGVTEEPVRDIKILDGQTAQTAFKHEINIRGLHDDTDMAQLYTWALAQTPVRLTGLGVNGVVTFQGSHLLAINKGFDGIVTVALKVTVESTGQYEAGYNPILIGVNALRNYDVASGAGNFVYGFDADAGIQTSYEGAGKQRLGWQSGTSNGVFTAPLFFPFVGERLTASASFTAMTDDWAIGFRFLDDTGTIISFNTVAVSESSVPIRASHTAVVPAGTFFIQFTVISVDDDGTTDFTTPQIALGTLTTYTNF